MKWKLLYKQFLKYTVLLPAIVYWVLFVKEMPDGRIKWHGNYFGSVQAMKDNVWSGYGDLIYKKKEKIVRRESSGTIFEVTFRVDARKWDEMNTRLANRNEELNFFSERDFID